MKKKNLAFTLAEVLIVIGIIGVVAALTLPNLNHATGDKERVTKVKKIYAALTEANDRAQVIYGDISDSYNSWRNEGYTGAQRAEKFGKRITEFMKISKECGLEVDQGCFSSGKSKNLSGSESSNYDSDNTYYKVVTADGMSLAFGDRGGGGLYIFVDIDGPNKGSYTKGKDLFGFNIDSNSSSSLYPQDSTKLDTSPSYYFHCLNNGENGGEAWILQNDDNSDYLNADSTGKCNDSDIILDGTTNTSCH